MRLINVHDLTLKEFTANPPEYVVLSHCWTNDEVSFKDLTKRRFDLESPGFVKIRELCEYVKSGGPAKSKLRKESSIEWIWIDTACIDKRNSAELSEAINSMWKIYRDSLACVVYLADVRFKTWIYGRPQSELKESRWFTRGWTLQELLAPSEVIFCDCDWQTIGILHEDSKIQDAVTAATGIERKYLSTNNAAEEMLHVTCVAKKLSWAAMRETTRPEDMAYCLLGLLDVNMPLLYGEGAKKAFLRLQSEFIKQSDDESIFAWSHYWSSSQTCGILATDISRFLGAGNIEPIPSFDHQYTNRSPYTITNKGLFFEATAKPVTYHESVSSSVSGKRRRRKYFRPTSRLLGLSTIARSSTIWLISLNCLVNSFPDASAASQAGDPERRTKRKRIEAEPANERRRCVIAIQEGQGGVAARVRSNTIRLELGQFEDTGNAELDKKFLIKLAD